MSVPLPTRVIEGAYRLLASTTPYTAWAHFAELQRNQWRPRADLEAIRWRKLQSLLADAAARVPFYQELWRQAGVDPQRFRELADLQQLPVVTRRMLLDGQARDAFLLSQRRDYQVTHSSGTTGPRVYLPFTRRDMQVKYANYLREFYATDWRLGMRSAAIHYFGHPEFGGRYLGEPDRDNYVLTRRLVFRGAHRRLLLPPATSTGAEADATVAGWYRTLRRYRPFLLETMDAGLFALAHHIEDHGLPPLRIPRTIVFATLASGLRKRLEAAFSTEIFDRYGPHEMEGVAYACHQHRGMHMAIDSVHTEFLDRDHRPVPVGEPGRVVLTDLDSRVMPLIRYDIGDLASWLEEPCPCGRGFPLMSELAGRVRDQFQTADGREMSPARLIAALQQHPAVRLFQLVQDAGGRVEARIVPAPGTWNAGTAEAIRQALTAACPDDARLVLQVRQVDRVALEPNGKFSAAKRVA